MYVSVILLPLLFYFFIKKKEMYALTLTTHLLARQRVDAPDHHAERADAQCPALVWCKFYRWAVSVKVIFGNRSAIRTHARTHIYTCTHTKKYGPSGRSCCCFCWAGCCRFEAGAGSGTLPFLVVDGCCCWRRPGGDNVDDDAGAFRTTACCCSSSSSTTDDNGAVTDEAVAGLSGDTGLPKSRRHSCCCSARSLHCCSNEQPAPTVVLRDESRLRRRRSPALLPLPAACVVACIGLGDGGVETAVGVLSGATCDGAAAVLAPTAGEPHEERRVEGEGGWSPRRGVEEGAPNTILFDCGGRCCMVTRMSAKRSDRGLDGLGLCACTRRFIVCCVDVLIDRSIQKIFRVAWAAAVGNFFWAVSQQIRGVWIDGGSSSFDRAAIC